MKNSKACPTLIHPVNIVLPLPLDCSPTKPAFSLESPEDRVPHRRRRSSTFTAIKNWASTVQPGSPAPNSPRNSSSPVIASRRGSLSVARDFISRRTSISHSRAPSSSSVVHLIETPRTSGHKQSGFDLTSLGYTSVFVNLDHPPSTPSPFLLRDPYPSLRQVTQQKEAPKGLKKIKSFGMLKRNRRKSTVAPEEPASRPRSHSRSKSALATPSKKSVHPPLPPTLASELLLRQFTDGGSLETHAKRMMQEQSRQAAPAGADKSTLPLGTLYRDENGMLWQDEDEKLEREALLPPGTPESPVREWITFHPFGNVSPSPALPGMALGVGAIAESEERRGSLASVNSLSPNNIVTPADGSAYAMHMLRPEPPSPLSWSGSTTAPVSPTATVSTATGMVIAAASGSQNKRNRRRPAPLRLNPPTFDHAFDDSFVPSPRAVALASLNPGLAARRHSSTGGLGLSAPATRTEFVSASGLNCRQVPDGNVLMKENVHGSEVDSASFTTMGSRRALGMKKISKLNLRALSVKAIFGGNAQ